MERSKIIAIKMTPNELQLAASALQIHRKKLKVSYNPGCFNCRRNVRSTHQATQTALSKLTTQTRPNRISTQKRGTLVYLQTHEWMDISESLEFMCRDIEDELKESCPSCPNTPKEKYKEAQELIGKIDKETNQE